MYHGVMALLANNLNVSIFKITFNRDNGGHLKIRTYKHTYRTHKRGLKWTLLRKDVARLWQRNMNPAYE